MNIIIPAIIIITVLAAAAGDFAVTARRHSRRRLYSPAPHHVWRDQSESGAQSAAGSQK